MNLPLRTGVMIIAEYSCIIPGLGPSEHRIGIAAQKFVDSSTERMVKLAVERHISNSRPTIYQ